MKHKLNWRPLAIFAAMLFGLIALSQCQTLQSFAYSVPMRPDGIVCQDVGLLGGKSPVSQPAGQLYYLNTTKPLTLTVDLGGATFDMAGYDNDGTPNTGYRFVLDGKVTMSNTIKTDNNDWSGWYRVDGAKILFFRPPLDHNSTWICFHVIKGAISTPPTPTTTSDIPSTVVPPTITPTPPSTPVPDTSGDVGVTVLGYAESSTGEHPVPEPTASVHSDSVDFAPPGYTVTLRVNVFNLSNNAMRGVHVQGFNLDTTMPTMAAHSNQSYTIVTHLFPGTNIYSYNVSTTDVDTNDQNDSTSAVIEAESCGGAVPLDAVTQYMAICATNRLFVPFVGR